MKSNMIVFLGLNVQRALSVIVLLLVLAATCVTIAKDFRAVHYAKQHPTTDRPAFQADDVDDVDAVAASAYKCDYVLGTDVPSHVGGLWWAQVNRAFLLLQIILCLMSELSVPLTDRFFNHCLPMFGPQFGTAVLGLVQMSIASSLLSHYLENFPLVVSWMLFAVGTLSLFTGLIFRAPMKNMRSFYASRRAEANHEPAKAPAMAESASCYSHGSVNHATLGLFPNKLTDRLTPSPPPMPSTAPLRPEAKKNRWSVRPFRTNASKPVLADVLPTYARDRSTSGTMTDYRASDLPIAQAHSGEWTRQPMHRAPTPPAMRHGARSPSNNYGYI